MAKFRVRARAVDMLGRQQIAGIPTAISELFKNAHDAYAREVCVDYYRRDGLFVLRDDGLGMSRKAFEQRWLTIGTESKLGSGIGLEAPPIDPAQAVRPIMGEKGIGRLAIAVIGPQVLVLTKPNTNDGTGEITAAFVHWGLFTLPGIDLSDIEIPTRTFKSGVLPGREDVQEMVDEVRESLKRLRAHVLNKDVKAILDDLDLFDIDPEAAADFLPPGPSLRGNGTGTHFIIKPTDTVLLSDIEGYGKSGKATPLEKVLLGFSNTMVPEVPEPPIRAYFRDHKLNNIFEERIANEQFFTPEEFTKADHQVFGEFDEYGQFTGKVTVYGKEPKTYIKRWGNVSGEKTICGPFNISFAYVQGNLSQSRLPADIHAEIMNKLDKMGGIYLYRDGIRILPYGDSDVDFLDIERRRTLSASYYFFSYRRMFGVINVSRKNNPRLVEKAGREGFRENAAYRQFKSILESFLVNLAGDFFREGGVEAEPWLLERERLSAAHIALQRRTQQIRGKREALKIALMSFFESMKNATPQKQLKGIVEEAEFYLSNMTPENSTAEDFLRLESKARSAIAKVDEQHKIIRPRGIGLTKEIARVWARYEMERQLLESEIIPAAVTKLEQILNSVGAELLANIDKRKRLTTAIEEIGSRERKRTRSLHSEARGELNEVAERVKLLTRESLSSVEQTIQRSLMTLDSTDTSEFDEGDYSRFRKELEEQIIEISKQKADTLGKLRDQLKGVGTIEGLELIDTISYMEDELEDLRDRDSESLYFAQMGMAVGIVHHEFETVIKKVRENLQQMKPWAARNEKFSTLFGEVTSSYEHLDSYLNLFTPFNPRLRRTKAIITGSQIQKFLLELFTNRLLKHSVSLDITESFKSVKIEDFRSNLYPVFVNLIDNAIHWLGQSVNENRNIIIGFHNNSIAISDNGPGIPLQDVDAIFERGFSRKVNGSGLGLYIAREVLTRSGYDISLKRPEHGDGATFIISVPDQYVISEEDD